MCWNKSHLFYTFTQNWMRKSRLENQSICNFISFHRFLIPIWFVVNVWRLTCKSLGISCNWVWLKRNCNVSDSVVVEKGRCMELTIPNRSSTDINKSRFLGVQNVSRNLFFFVWLPMNHIERAVIEFCGIFLMEFINASVDFFFEVSNFFVNSAQLFFLALFVVRLCSILVILLNILTRCYWASTVRFV